MSARTENREGVELEIHRIGEGIEKYRVLNWPMSFTLYTDPETKALTKVYTPGVVVAGELSQPSSSRVGGAFPEKDSALEPVVHPIVSISKAMGEFGGVDLESHRTAVEWSNYFLQERGFPFRTEHNPEKLAKAVEAGYLRTGTIEGAVVYFPQERAVRAMCNKRIEDFSWALALHTGVPMGTGHRKPLPELGD